MRYLSLFTLLVMLLSCSGGNQYDVCIYGGTSAGVIAASTAALQGHSVVVVEPLDHIGGMTTGGLGQTDIGNKQVVQGLSRRFFRDLGAHYGLLEKWVFEPSVATGIFESYLDNPKISVFRQTGLYRVQKNGAVIRSIEVRPLDGEWRFTGNSHKIRAKVFIDASYEGDLMAAAGVSYTVGRESTARYGESWNGRHLSINHQLPDGIDPYVIPGQRDSGLLPGVSEEDTWAEGDSDTLVQAYNFRICLTDSLENSIPLERPERYDSIRYELLARLLAAQGAADRYFIWDRMPCRKTDINNYGGFSTDLIGGSNQWPEAAYPRRREIWQEHYDYTLGLLWFMQSDPRVPESIRAEMSRWGLPKDEYPRSGHWSPQLYVREGRRMISDYVITQADCEGRTVVEDGIALAAYTMDSHNCRRIVVDGMVKNEGNVETKIPGPYSIPYRAIVPKREDCTNLVVPVCLSASHIAFGSVRMEPVFMTLGQLAAMAADEAISKSIAVQDVSAAAIREMMETDPYLDGSAPDILIDDLTGSVSAPGWKQVRKNRGYGPSYLELPVSASNVPAVFGTEIPSAGWYSVYSYTNLKDELAPVARYLLENAGKRYETEVDSRSIPLVGQTKGDWAPLGEYYFQAGPLSVTVTGEDVPIPLRCDAVLCVRSASRDTVRILGVGNSWTRDSMRYLSAIAASAGRPVIVGHAYLGGSTLEDQWHGITDTSYCYTHNGEAQRVHSTYQYWKYEGSIDPVKTPFEGYCNGLAGIGVTLEYAVADEPWDWIVFQPEATLGGDWRRHLGQGTDGYSLGALIADVKKMMSPEVAAKVKLALMVPFAYPEGNTDYREKFLAVYNRGKTPKDQAEWDRLYRKQYKLIQRAAPRICRSLGMDESINVGAAIQAARMDADLSRCGYLLQRRQDNTHLAEGIPKYIASLCYAYTLLGIGPEEITFYIDDPELAAKARTLVYKTLK